MRAKMKTANFVNFHVKAIDPFRKTFIMNILF